LEIAGPPAGKITCYLLIKTRREVEQNKEQEWNKYLQTEFDSFIYQVHTDTVEKTGCR